MSRKPQPARDLEHYEQDALENEQAADTGRLFPETEPAAEATVQEIKLWQKARLLGMRTAPLRTKDGSPLELPPDKLAVWARIEEAAFEALVAQARQSVWNGNEDDPYTLAENAVLEVAENFAKGKLATTEPGGLVLAFQKTLERRVLDENELRKKIAANERQIFDGARTLPVDDPGDTSATEEDEVEKGVCAPPKNRKWDEIEAWRLLQPRSKANLQGLEIDTWVKWQLRTRQDKAALQRHVDVDNCESCRRWIDGRNFDFRQFEAGRGFSPGQYEYLGVIRGVLEIRMLDVIPPGISNRCLICAAWSTHPYCRTCERETWMQPRVWEASNKRWQTNDRAPSWYPEAAQTIRAKLHAPRYADLYDQKAMDLEAYSSDLETVAERREGGYASYEDLAGEEVANDEGLWALPADSWERLWFDSLLEQAQGFQWMPPALQNLTPKAFRAWIEGVEGAVPDVALFRPYRRRVLRALRREMNGPPQIRICRQCRREFEGSDRAFYCGPRCRKAASRGVSRAVA